MENPTPKTDSTKWSFFDDLATQIINLQNMVNRNEQIICDIDKKFMRFDENREESPCDGAISNAPQPKRIINDMKEILDRLHENNKLLEEISETL